MPEPVFVIRNQHGLYLTRQNEWVDGHDPAPLFKTPFRDVALNTLIEVNAKDIELRGVITEVEVNDKGLPRVVPADESASLLRDDVAAEGAVAETGIADADAQASSENTEQPGNDGVISPEEDN